MKGEIGLQALAWIVGRRRGGCLGHREPEFVEGILGTVRCQDCHARRLDHDASLMDVGQRGTAVLQDQGGIAGGDVAVGGVHPGATVRTAPDCDQGLGFQHTECFSQCRPGDTELFHEGRLGRQCVAFDEFSPYDPAS